MSPGCASFSRTAPAASSITEWATRQADSRHGRTFLRIFRIRYCLSRYTRSIANLIPKVWTASQGTIQRPSPGERLFRPNNPRERLAPLCATSTFVAIGVLRVMLVTRSCFFTGPEERPCLNQFWSIFKIGHLFFRALRIHPARLSNELTRNSLNQRERQGS
jgi:hypothetical protein